MPSGSSVAAFSFISPYNHIGQPLKTLLWANMEADFCPVLLFGREMACFLAPGPLCPSEIYLPSRVFFFRSGFSGRSKIISGSGPPFIWGVKIVFRATFRSSFGVRFDKKCKHFSGCSFPWSGGWAVHQLGTFPFFHHKKTTAPPCCPSRLHCQSVTKQGKSFALSVLVLGDGRPANKEIASFPLFKTQSQYLCGVRHVGTGNAPKNFY